MWESNDFFILTSSCKLVRGYKRSILIDYSRGEVYFLTHEYHTVIELLDRRRIHEVVDMLDDDSSKQFFDEFLNKLTMYEIGFITKSPELFPKISDEPIDLHIPVLNSIIEIDEAYFKKDDYLQVCEQLTILGCKDFQIRLHSKLNIPFLEEVVEALSSSSASYLEIHCSDSNQYSIEDIKIFVERNTLVSNVFVYGRPQNESYEVYNEIEGFHPIVLGQIHCLTYSLDGGNCCGIINRESLQFHDFDLHNQLKSRNGCLDRKITIDRFGDIRNCPSLPKVYGNISSHSLQSILDDQEFQTLWKLNKDQISVCQVCEFRYNCTDCRAFVTDGVYSKPSKCKYDPLNAKWEDNIDHVASKDLYNLF